MGRDSGGGLRRGALADETARISWQTPIVLGPAKPDRFGSAPPPEPPTAHLTNMQTALARALSVDDVNQLGRDTGQSERLRTVTPHRLFLSTVTALAGRNVETLADLLREFNYHNDTTVAYKAFYNRLARPGVANFKSGPRSQDRTPSNQAAPRRRPPLSDHL